MKRGDRKIYIRTGARLHFGLLDCHAPFGGLGLMVDQPETVIEVIEADAYQLSDSVMQVGFAERSDAIVSRACEHFGVDGLPPIKISILATPPLHQGFGSGTQYSLALAEACCRVLGDDSVPIETMVLDIAGRARRSAIGAHGYFVGGLIFESNSDDARLNPIQQRSAIPDSWCMALFQPASQMPVIAGQQEQAHFDQLKCQPERTELLRQIATDELMPAAHQADFAAFSLAIQRYNRESGLLFESIQGGPYNGTFVSETVDRLKQCGVNGVGQSSWGPTVFAWCEDRASAESLVSSWDVGDSIATVVTARNQGRALQQSCLERQSNHS
ncbi:beta-ribofuranosylaminobenzene 5'-phosphate synthase [Stieleria sp. JC731]|uniref:beta-ribofuranosylaminobenzene 5'-phosphate synthase n=1 Tax=Pirellulaceae TaxID=2691357 RepID=UPI001E5BED01|nr:beta-ribofuranosylaminobenzene 5'-phosphate synthase [Stieleria sp. JC731]MCC9602546.1 beta-ribofuranosylaminobenzene 5'-phosphate synthase [Stieleria sp. JC731]